MNKKTNKQDIVDCLIGVLIAAITYSITLGIPFGGITNLLSGIGIFVPIIALLIVGVILIVMKKKIIILTTLVLVSPLIFLMMIMGSCMILTNSFRV